MMTEHENVLYINARGEVVDEPIQIQQTECDNTVEFCATAVVPDGFTFVNTGIDAFCLDFSGLDCVLETVDVTVEIPNPCGGTLECPVFIQAVRAVGCARVHINHNALIPNQPGVSVFGECNLSFDTTVCVNQVIGYTCGLETCVEDCFAFGGATIISPVVTSDICGRQIVSIRGTFGLTFVGC